MSIKCCYTISRKNYERIKKDGIFNNFHTCPFDQTKMAVLAWYDTKIDFKLWDHGEYSLECNTAREPFRVWGRVIDKDHFMIDEAIIIGKRTEKADRFLSKYEKIMAMGHSIAVYEYREAC